MPAALLYPPGPKPRIPGANLLAFRRDPLGFLTKIARDYGDIAHFKLGAQDLFLFNHPDYVKDVLVTQAHKFHKGRGLEKARRLLGQGLLTSEDEFHLRQRRLAQPAFHRQRLASYARAMTEHALRLRERWQQVSGSARDIHQEMMRLTLAIAGKTLFDADVEGEAKEIGEAITAALVNLSNLFLLPFSDLLEKLPLPGRLRVKKARERLDSTIYRIIQARRAGGEDRGDLLSMLLEAQDPEGDGGRMSDQQLRDECMTLFLAGHETTAVALTWTWYLLSQHPACEARLHAELDAVLRGRPPAAEDFSQLRYTEMVLAESMRLYPPAWVIGRRAVEPYAIEKYTVRPGDIVLVSPYVLHHDPRYYPDPSLFDPERWTPEARAARPKFAYFPFGAGPRQCMGEGFAWMEGLLVMATLAQQWRLRLVPGHSVEAQPLITLRPRHGMRMTLEQRESFTSCAKA